MTTMRRKDGSFRGVTGNALPLDIKSVTGEGEFEGYGSVFGVVDQGRDVMMPNAFTNSLAARGNRGVKMLWQHDTTKVIGVWTEIREDVKGLYVKGRILSEVGQGREALALMRAGAVDGLSIGYRTKADEYDREADLRRLTEVDLMEVSLVTFPMNESATISLVKAGAIATEREFEAHLRDAGLSRQQAKAFIADGYKAMTNLRDAGETGNDAGLQAALADLRSTFL